jgi:hypothetical protein
MMVSTEAQTGLQLTDAAVQCEPPAVDADELRRWALAPELAAFLSSATPLCEEALQQNELVDVMADELAGLVDEEGAADGAAGGAVGTGGGGRSTAVGLVEQQSFSDLVHSKGKVVVAAQWHPVRRGVAAVACIHPPQAQPAQQAGAAAAGAQQLQQPAVATASSTLAMLQPPPGSILVWSQADCVHPETVLHAPSEVLALAYHPSQPHWLAAGLITGQVALFNLQQALPGAVLGAPTASAQALPPRSGMAGEADQREEIGRPAALLPTHVSLPEASHKAAVTDLQWLPSTLVSRDGKLEAAAASPTKEASSLSAATVTATAAVPAGAPDSCTLFATTAADGSLLVWDMRISARQRKPAAVKGTCQCCCCAVLPCPLSAVGCTAVCGLAGALPSPSLVSRTLHVAPTPHHPPPCHCFPTPPAADEEQLEWKPVLGLAASSTCKQPMPATRFCPDPRTGPARFVLGSLEGELAVVDGGAACTEHRVRCRQQGQRAGGMGLRACACFSCRAVLPFAIAQELVTQQAWVHN